ncbi:MAG: HAE1 family hydrophobic/amphiphilic exporter-1, partial [Saprospiraceae bacterium]
MKLISLSIKRPSLVIVVFAILTIAGLFSSRLMSYELLPNFNVPVITIIAVYPGASPIEVETAVVKKVENIIAGVSGIKTLFAISNENYCVFKVELEGDANPDLVENSIQKKITQNMEQFPKEMRPPNIGKFAFDDLPVMKLALYSSLPPVEFNELVENNIEPALARLDGVAQIKSLGGVQREIQVNLIRKKLETYTVSIYQVLEAIKMANVELPAGKLKGEETQILVRFAGKITTIKQLNKVVVSTLPDGTVVKLEDIADVIDTNKDLEILVRANGKEALGLTINKQSDANAVNMSAEVRAVLDNLEKSYAEQNLKIDIIQDTSQFTLEAANGVFDDLILAIILVAMVMFVFLKSIRNSLIIMLVVPLSLVAT